ncbi:MAG: hypoxanthine phosphoribosyltransferase [bacterium]
MDPVWDRNVEDIKDKRIFSKKTIEDRVKKLGEKISKDYRGKNLLIIGILRGAFIFMADLIRQIEIPIEVDFMLVSSYGDRKDTSGVVRIVKDTKKNIQGRDVLIIEDIVDTGLTYYNLKETLLTREPESLKICALLNKLTDRQKDVEVDYYGFETNEEFLVGYGLDYQERFRECPYIFRPTPQALENLEE